MAAIGDEEPDIARCRERKMSCANQTKGQGTASGPTEMTAAGR
jgi:hypothetical protein